jgi:hypothetical protein
MLRECGLLARRAFMVKDLHTPCGCLRRRPGPQPERGTQSCDLQLTRHDEHGTFYTTGREHSSTNATGTGSERTPWHATQRAAWEALSRVND